jgi:transglutaminase-like putative cysteine protease
VGLLGAALALWGWETGLLPAGLAAAALVEGPARVRARWDLARGDFNRVSDLSSVLFVGAAVYLGLTRDAARALVTLVQWLPLLVLPLVAAQRYSSAQGVDPRIFFWSQRKQADEEGGAAERLIDLGYPYLGLVLLGAAAANDRGPLFYAAAAGLLAWALWPARPAGRRRLAWAACFAVAVGAGAAGHVGLHQLHRLLEASALEWIADWLRRDADPFRASTALGQLGRLKLRDRIVLRVTPEGPAHPLLLREASYNVWTAPAWLAVGSSFSAVTPEADATTWRLAPGLEPTPAAWRVAAPLRRGRGVLPLPAGAFRLERLAAVRLSRNSLGTVKVDEGLPLALYRAASGPGSPRDAPPGRVDLELRAPAAEVAGRVVEELGLRGRPAAEVVAGLRAYLADGFRYSPYVEDVRLGDPIEDFLRRRRAGHCEYFAAATALLLRAAGVPARYATGYAVQEWSGWEAAFVVRERHAHAWALAWVDGAWRDVDTTPAAWLEEEAAAAGSFWRPALDVLSWIGHVVERWRVGDRRDGAATWLGWLVLPLAGWLAWRISRRARRAAPAAGPRGRPAPAGPGADSELYLVERRLAEAGLPRERGEALGRWARRVAPAAGLDGGEGPLARLVGLHYRYRFDPRGLSPAERAELRAAATALLGRLGPGGR